MAGGRGDSLDDLSSTEILMKGGNKWETVQPLPNRLYNLASVSLPDSVLLIGNLYNIYC